MAKLKDIPQEGRVPVGATLRYEEILVKTYFVDQEVKAYSHASNNPVFSALIHLRGKPSMTGASATSAEIHFYPDGDTRISVPTYNEHQKRIELYAPLSALPDYMATLSGEGRPHLRLLRGPRWSRAQRLSPSLGEALTHACRETRSDLPARKA